MLIWEQICGNRNVEWRQSKAEQQLQIQLERFDRIMSSRCESSPRLQNWGVNKVRSVIGELDAKINRELVVNNGVDCGVICNCHLG